MKRTGKSRGIRQESKEVRLVVYRCCNGYVGIARGGAGARAVCMSVPRYKGAPCAGGASDSREGDIYGETVTAPCSICLSFAAHTDPPLGRQGPTQKAPRSADAHVSTQVHGTSPNRVTH